MVRRNPQLKWADIGRRGYLSLTLTPSGATGSWYFLDTVRRPSTTLSGIHAMHVEHGANRFASSR
jgi:alkaline phosphatase D